MLAHIEARLGQHDQRLAPGLLSAQAESRHAPLPDPVYRGGSLFHLLGYDVATADDDQVFPASGDEELPIGDVAEVAAVEESAVLMEARVGFAQVAGGGRGPSEEHPPNQSLGEGSPLVIGHADLVSGEGRSGGDEDESRLVPWWC